MAKEKKHPKNCKCKDCMKAKKPIKESFSHLANFVKAITEKNYAAANKYLHTVVQDKMKSRIAQCADVKPF